MDGLSDLGCVAGSPASPAVAFQQGDLCRSDRISGELLCSSIRGMPLDERSCPLPVAFPLYLTTLSDCF